MKKKRVRIRANARAVLRKFKIRGEGEESGLLRQGSTDEMPDNQTYGAEFPWSTTATTALPLGAVLGNRLPHSAAFRGVGDRPFLPKGGATEDPFLKLKRSYQ